MTKNFNNLSDGESDGFALFYIKDQKLKSVSLTESQASILDLILPTAFGDEKVRVVDPSEEVMVGYLKPKINKKQLLKEIALNSNLKEELEKEGEISLERKDIKIIYDKGGLTTKLIDKEELIKILTKELKDKEYLAENDDVSLIEEIALDENDEICVRLQNYPNELQIFENHRVVEYLESSFEDVENLIEDQNLFIFLQDGYAQDFGVSCKAVDLETGEIINDWLRILEYYRIDDEEFYNINPDNNKKIYVIYTTDVWKSTNSRVLRGVTTSVEQLEKAKQLLIKNNVVESEEEIETLELNDGEIFVRGELY